MQRRVVCSLIVSIAMLDSATWLQAQASAGRIEGRLVREQGAGVEGASVVVTGTRLTAITGPEGHFVFDDVPVGTYEVVAALGERSVTIAGITVSAGATIRVEEVVDWAAGFVSDLTVRATSRRSERIVDAPASVTRLTAADVEEKASHGQLPKLLEFVPGAQLTQGGLFDYNLNTRGFNSSLNRRLAVLVDGRNPSAAFFGAQEWAAIGFPLDDIASIELVRGPTAALYGANASSGILDIVTKEPRFSPGGFVRATFGEPGTANVDVRWAGAVGGQWFGKLAGGIRRSGDFFVSRRGATEYSVPCGGGVTRDCLPQEAVVPTRLNDIDVFFGSGRLDRYFDNGMVLTLEGGLAEVAGPVVQTGVGRTQVTDVSRPWARAQVSSDHVRIFAAYTGRDAQGQLALASGTNSTLTSHTWQFEGQTDRSFAQDRVRVVTGASAVVERIDSFDESRQQQSLLFEPVRSHQEALFGQLDWHATRRVRLVLAGRGDFSSLHDVQLSPKGSLVYAVAGGHSVRVTYNEAFQVPNYSEFFLQADAAPPVNLGALNTFCTPFGVACGFGPTRVLALGNRDLELEQVATLEFGYKTLVRGRGLITVDYYRSRATNFITDLLPQLGGPLGRINPAFGPWTAPEGLPPEVAAQIRAAAPAILSNNHDGSPILAAVSYTNFGRVDTQGVDAGLNYVLPGGWRGAASYSWSDFDIRDAVAGLESMLVPNSPAHSVSAGVGYVRPRFDADLSVRWVDAFRWSVGAFQGNVEAYTTADVTANYRLRADVTLGVNVANLFDDRHWEAFGGDVLRRRALVSIGYLW